MSLKTRGIVSIILLTTLFIGFISVIRSGVSLETNILKLIPDSKGSILSEKVEAFSESQTGEVVFLLSHKSEDTLIQLARQIEQELTASTRYESITGAVSEEQQRGWYDTYFPYRYSFLSEKIRRELRSAHAEKRVVRHIQRELYSVTPDYYGDALEKDPLFLFPSFMKSLFADEVLDTYEGYAVSRKDSLVSTIISATLAGSPFSLDIQMQAEEDIARWETVVRQRGGSFFSTGIVRFAAAAFTEAKREISLIGAVSLLGVLLILFFTFRSFRLLSVGVIPIVVGVITGFTVTAALFPAIHIIAVTMGASLTGIAIDYSLHYLTHLRFSPTPQSSVLRQVLPGITLGAVTTLIGYGVLGFGEFPGFQQIALFTGAGLIGSYLTVILLFPILLRTCQKKTVISFPSFPFPLKYLRWGVVPLLLLLIVGGAHIKTNDKIFDLRTPMPELDREEDEIRGFSAGIEGSRFVVVTGENDEQLLQNLEQAAETLDSLVEENALAGYISVSRYVMSKKRAEENLQLLNNAVTENEELKAVMNSLGFAAGTYEKISADISSSKIMTMDHWLESSVSKPWRRLVHSDDGDCFSIILLKTVSDEVAMATHFQNQNIQYINKVAEVSKTLGMYRNEATTLVCIAYIIILIILIVRYGMKSGIMIFLPPVLAGGVALVLPGLFGHSITFMHIMALLLVLGIGIDYTIFFAEGSSHRQETLLAVLLSALSTILAFGVLGLSSTPALQAIGGIITPGIILSFILAPLFVKADR